MGDKSQASRNRHTAPRLYHTKSRHGCSRCRQRRVKCDESRPACNNCHRHKVPCVYDRPASGDTVPAHKTRQQRAVADTAVSSLPSSSSANPSPAASSPGLGNITPRHEYWKMRALHHFTVFTSATMPAGHLATVRDCWVRQVPVLALDHEPLLNALLALSALHLIKTGTSDADLAACRVSWLEAALRTHRQGLDIVNVSTIDCACFTSSLLHVDNFACLKDRPLEPYELPIHWFRMLMGTRAVVQVYQPIMNDDEIPVFKTIMDSYSDSINGNMLHNDTTPPNPKVSYLLDDHGLDDMRDPGVAEAYRQAVVYIGWMKTAVDSKEHTMVIYRKVLAFPSQIDQRFPDFVRAKAPRALIIVAHLFAFGMYCRDIWTVSDTPQREVRGICNMIPPALQHLVAWPLSILAEVEAGSS